MLTYSGWRGKHKEAKQTGPRSQLLQRGWFWILDSGLLLTVCPLKGADDTKKFQRLNGENYQPRPK